MANTNQPDIRPCRSKRAIGGARIDRQRLEEGKVPLEESVAIYERGRGAQAPVRGAVAPGRRPGERSPSMPPAATGTSRSTFK